ncbi:MAG: type IV toxin-antitoxin system AbiEi family antitoxin domain-containing protein [Vallitaleaceae bacterium]|nr:type IV toxin-antitoxin system AbiEi family antitoxin domain-containing protein [Vallitaleaceae bacterium]
MPMYFVTPIQITEAGIPRRCLSEMTTSGIIYKVDRGIYALPEVWEDELYFMQYRFSKGIFSHETALYLHAMTDRTPITYTMTFPQGYNTSSVRRQGVTAKLSIIEYYELGLTEVSSPCKNPLRVYDTERTLCDMVKIKHSGDIQVINQAMKIYAASKSKDIAKLVSYAEKLRVSPKILTYMEVLL